ncbi:MAG: hypothetical protein KY429_01960 [Actinobacteria bacterium]|nr:hypothetical protein [Actinomycetota bacterium]
MKSKRLRAERTGVRLVALVCLIIVATGCARRPQSGVNVRALTADLVFGIPPVAEPAAPPDLDPAEPPPIRHTGGSTRPFESNTTPFVAPGAEPCPEAAPDEFADEVATVDVPVLPKEGKYRWVTAGTQKLPSGDTYTLAKFSTRTIQNVEKRGFGHSFETVQTALTGGGGDKVTQFWQVRTVPPANPLLHNTDADDRGIYLKAIEEDRGGQVSSFVASPPLLFLRLPVETGYRATAGTDPRGEFDTTAQDENGSGATLRHKGVSLNQVDIDACGTKIRGWFMDADQEFVRPAVGSPERYLRNYDYVIATQMGGILIMEHVERTVPPAQEPDLVYDTRIGQVEPDDSES